MRALRNARCMRICVALASETSPVAATYHQLMWRLHSPDLLRCAVWQVVMSRGGYTSAIDMWSAGCIFGELLQRVARVGSATTPHLQVAPLFAIHGLPKTPGEG